MKRSTSILWIWLVLAPWVWAGSPDKNHLPVPNSREETCKLTKCDEHPLLVHVKDFKRTPWTARARMPTQTNCSTYGDNVQCTTTGGNDINWSHVTSSLTVVVDDPAADKAVVKELTVECDAAVRWSKCIALEPGTYPGRWDKKRLEILYVDPNKESKPKAVKYSVMGSILLHDANGPTKEGLARLATDGTTAASDDGMLTVTSTPEAADVYSDGNFVGTTPSKLKLKSGKHTIRIVLAGYKEWSREVTVPPGSELTLASALEKQ